MNKLDNDTITAIIEDEKNYRFNHQLLLKTLDEKYGDKYKIYRKNHPSNEQLVNNVIELIRDNLNIDSEKEKIITMLQLQLKSENIWAVRQTFTEYFSWAIPDYEAIEAILDFTDNGKILSIGSGLGLWEALLRSVAINLGYDINIIATDRSPFPNREWIKVKKMNHKEAVNINADTLFLCWPPYSSSDEIFSLNYNPMGFETLSRFKGNKLIYIGEGKDGCTADDDFHSLLNQSWYLAKKVCIPRWSFIHDSVYLYKRK